MSKEQKFINEPSRKFYHFFQDKINAGDLTAVELTERMGKYQSSPSSLLGGLKSGKYSVTVEMILIAEEKFGLNPCFLFGKAEQKNIVISTQKIDSDLDLEERLLRIEEAVGLIKKHRRSG